MSKQGIFSSKNVFSTISSFFNIHSLIELYKSHSKVRSIINTLTNVKFYFDLLNKFKGKFNLTVNEFYSECYEQILKETSKVNPELQSQILGMFFSYFLKDKKQIVFRKETTKEEAVIYRYALAYSQPVNVCKQKKVSIVCVIEDEIENILFSSNINYPSVRKLLLNNGYNRNDPRTIPDNLLVFNKLQSLIIYGYINSEEKYQVILNFLRNSENIQSLAMETKSNEQFFELLNVLKLNPTLKFWKIVDTMNLDRMLAFCEILNSLVKLEEVHMIGTEIGPEGSMVLANCLKTNRSITKLELPYNKLQDQGLTFLAQCLEENKTLTTLNLYQNSFTITGIENLVKSLKQNKTLQNLNLANNDLPVTTLDQFAELFEENSSLSILDLCYNSAITYENVREKLYQYGTDVLFS
jgi:hypothetical protein